MAQSRCDCCFALSIPPAKSDGCQRDGFFHRQIDLPISVSRGDLVSFLSKQISRSSLYIMYASRSGPQATAPPSRTGQPATQGNEATCPHVGYAASRGVASDHYQSDLLTVAYTHQPPGRPRSEGHSSAHRIDLLLTCMPRDFSLLHATMYI